MRDFFITECNASTETRTSGTSKARHFSESTKGKKVGLKEYAFKYLPINIINLNSYFSGTFLLSMPLNRIHAKYFTCKENSSHNLAKIKIRNILIYTCMFWNVCKWKFVFCLLICCCFCNIHLIHGYSEVQSPTQLSWAYVKGNVHRVV